jgi:N-acetylglucosamine-6-phosphate deacetylase
MSLKYFDLQLNGYAGVDFNRDDLNIEDFHYACGKLKHDGVEGTLATIITASIDKMVKCIRQIVDFRREDPLAREIIYGIHVEGPFLSTETGYPGAHNPTWIRPGDLQTTNKLLDAADGLVRLFTLAPEVDEDFMVTKTLHKNGVVVSAGHTNAGMDILKQGLDNGLTMFTHLGNGCPVNMDRHNNIIQRVLSLGDNIWKTFIVDELHIPLFALKNYIEVAGTKKSIVVTDAMAAAAAEPGRYTIGEIELEVGSDGIVREPGKPNFAGSAITMAGSHHILKDKMKFSEDQIRQMLYDNPRHALGMD